MEYKNAWLIIAKANLHVGNENISNYGLIDKAIQRDIVTNLPCINSSSLKGAINEYTTMVCTTSITPQQRISIFGVDKNDKSKTQKGNTVFFDANILALPRPNDHTLYELATCDAVLDRFVERLSIFQLPINKATLINKIQTICGRTPIIYSSEQFKDFCEDDELPIIARNCLDNGESKNLWYEQVLPRETVLGTLLLSSEDTLAKVLNGKVIQIGANATIGYGYCEFIQL